MGTFADGLRKFHEVGIKGPNVRLTKKRARILLEIIRKLEDETTLWEESRQDDYCATLQWMANQVHKRWSLAQIHGDT